MYASPFMYFMESHSSKFGTLEWRYQHGANVYVLNVFCQGKNEMCFVNVICFHGALICAFALPCKNASNICEYSSDRRDAS
mmetsp:Transcript_53041/g.158742  ORF Transcript_53041/g.158742 Transcript_53041/m.158742 type:complete len:81 (-) Transcript_53041:217-459(-)